MLAPVSLLAVGQLVTSLLRPVDFQLMPPPSQPTLEAPSQASSAESEATPPAPRYSIAHGFGNAILLAFAIKQIVPATFRVVYRGPVDPDLPVTWTGGWPWNQVLAAALRQHGLRLVLIGHAVTVGY
jgi:hypothetical protein